MFFARAASETARAARAVPLRAGAAVAAAGVAGSGAAVLCDDDSAHPAHFPWPHSGPLSSFDHKAIRRGWEVYRQVCASCHSIEFITFGDLIGVTHSKSEVKTMAKEFDVEDGPDMEGNMFERPGKQSDTVPGPFKNENAAAAANNGSVPPDLTLLTLSREGGADYLMALLTGYCDPPVGEPPLETGYYNPYFEGGVIAMPPPLMDGQIEYSDGTPATVSQMAKDVTTFLSWAAEPEHDERKRMGFQWVSAMVIAAGLAGYYKRFRWAPLKTRKISYHK